MKCRNCGKEVMQYRYKTSGKLKWVHTGTYRIYCVSYTKAEPTKETIDG